MQSKTTLANIVRKHFSRSINFRYHELHCEPRRPGDVSYIYDFQFGAGTEKNGDFEEVDQGFNQALVTYKKEVSKKTINR